MTRKGTHSTSVLRGIAPFIAVLTVMIALAAQAQARRSPSAIEESSSVQALPNVGARPTADPLYPNASLFLPPVTYDAGQCPSSVAIADVSGDGKPDLVVTDDCTNSEGSVGVFLGNGDGTFKPAVTYDSGGRSDSGTSVAIGDLDLDGVPDLVVPNSTSGNVGVLLGQGDGTFLPVATQRLCAGGLEIIDAPALADVNGDGRLDLLVANAGCFNSMGVLLGIGDGTFQDLGVYYDSGGFDADSIAVADVNGDGKADVAVGNCGNNFYCNQSGHGTVGVLLGNGDGTFQSVRTYGSSGLTHSVAVADVNHDGKPDLLVANDCSHCEGSVDVLLGNGDGTFQPIVTYDSGGQGAASVVVADINGDGKPDLLVANKFSNTVGLLLGNGDGTFRLAVTYDSGGTGPSWVAAADLNGDGKLDLVVSNQGGGPNGDGLVSVLMNNASYTPRHTTATLTSSVNPSVFGQVVTFTAAVSSGTGTPTGTVVFLDGSTELGRAILASGSASISVPWMAPGSHSVTAVYKGDGRYRPSTSASVKQVVNLATTTTSLASSQNPAVITEFVTYTATVASQYGGAATGTVMFQDGGSTVATVTMVGDQAAYTTKYSTPGTHSITATYSGDANNTGSVSSALVEQINKGFSSKTVLTTSGSPSFVGQAVTFTATVTSGQGAIPDGELVTFYDGMVAIGTGSTASGVATFTTSSLTAKTHTIKASYPGDAIFRPSTGLVTQVVNKYPTTTTLSSSPNPSQFGQKVTFTAQVTSSGPAPTGTVAFRDGTNGIGSATLSGGVATFTRSRLAVGTHSITAHYNGDAASSTSTSSVVNQVVQ
jgi:hypothetical protein